MMTVHSYRGKSVSDGMKRCLECV